MAFIRLSRLRQRLLVAAAGWGDGIEIHRGRVASSTSCWHAPFPLDPPGTRRHLVQTLRNIAGGGACQLKSEGPCQTLRL